MSTTQLTPAGDVILNALGDEAQVDCGTPSLTPCYDCCFDPASTADITALTYAYNQIVLEYNSPPNDNWANYALMQQFRQDVLEAVSGMTNMPRKPNPDGNYWCLWFKSIPVNGVLADQLVGCF